MRNRIERGFTLIELVVVITILGILAAFAVPRFIALEGQARIAALNGLTGSLRSATALAHGMWLATGNSPASITMEGQTITMTNGYPSAADITKTLVDYAGFTPTAAPTTTNTFTKDGAGTPANCSVVYTAATAAVPASVSTPTTSGC
jgi:MSHA pilin protein MshA